MFLLNKAALKLLNYYDMNESKRMQKKTLVLGASLKPERASNRLLHMLEEANIHAVAVGGQAGTVGRTPILTQLPELDNIHTVSLYLRPALQEIYMNRIIELEPQRVIFNPGAENPAFEMQLQSKGIETENACSLVMMRLHQF